MESPGWAPVCVACSAVPSEPLDYWEGRQTRAPLALRGVSVGTDAREGAGMSSLIQHSSELSFRDSSRQGAGGGGAGDRRWEGRWGWAAPRPAPLVPECLHRGSDRAAGPRAASPGAPNLRGCSRWCKKPCTRPWLLEWGCGWAPWMGIPTWKNKILALRACPMLVARAAECRAVGTGVPGTPRGRPGAVALG